MKCQSLTDHARIREWAQTRRAHPARLVGSGTASRPAVLRMVIANGYNGDAPLEDIGWSEFFLQFEQQRLALLFQDRREDGSPSTFNKLVSRDQR